MVILLRQRIILIIFAVFFITLFTPSPKSQEYKCDPAIPTYPPSNTQGYQRRGGERCEGIYSRQLSNKQLEIVGFTQTYTTPNIYSDDIVDLSWSPPSNITGSIMLKAVGINTPWSYQMDTKLELSQNSYSWKMNVLPDLDLEWRRLGLLGYTEALVNGETKRVYLPIRVGQSNTVTEPYKLTMRTSGDVAEVYTSIFPQQIQKLNPDYKPLGQAAYPKVITFPLDISLNEPTGIYRLYVAIKWEDNSSPSLENILFYHQSLRDKAP